MASSGKQAYSQLSAYLGNLPALLLNMNWSDDGLAQLSPSRLDPLFVCAPNLMMAILNDRWHFMRSGAIYGGGEDTAAGRVASGLLSMNGLEHEYHRKPFVAFLRSADLQSQAFEVAARLTEAEIAEWSHGDEIAIVSVMRRISFRLIGELVLGITDVVALDVLASRVDDWVTCGMRVESRTKNWEGKVAPGAEGCAALLERALLAAVGEVDPARAPPLLSWLVRRHGEGAITRQAFIGQLVTILTAAWETTSSALSWSLLLLASHADVAARLSGELASVQRRYRDVADLPYLRAVVAETLRLCPPAPAIKRICMEAHILDQLWLAEGTEVVLGLLASHHRTRDFDDPHRFVPERWLMDAARPGYLPFGFGWRRCVGDRLASTEIVGVLSTLLATFSFELISGRPVNIRSGLAMSPADDVRLVVAPARTWQSVPWPAGEFQMLVQSPEGKG
jgi:cytochrome P450